MRPSLGVQSKPVDVLAREIKNHVDRDQGEHHREHLEDEQGAQSRRFELEVESGERVGSRSGQEDDADRSGGGDFDRVPEPEQRGCFGLDHARFARGRVDHLLIRDAQNIFPMLQTDLVWQQPARREVAPAQGSRYNDEIRHQDQRSAER